MSSYRENQKECVITRQGQANIYKQGNGYKFAITGYALFKDVNYWLRDKCLKPDLDMEVIDPATGKLIDLGDKDDVFDFNCLRDLTLDDVKKNLNVIFKGVTYSYDNNLHRPNPTQYAKAWNDIENHLFPVQHAYNYDEAYIIDTDGDGKEEENQNNYNNAYISYDVIINRELVDVTDVTGDQTFDGIIFIARPFKNEPQDDGLDIIDPQKPVLFAVQYFAVDKLMILLDQKDRLVMNVEMHVGYAYNEYGEDSIYDIQNNIPVEYNERGLVQGIHLANDASTNTIMTDAESYETTNKLYIANLREGSDDPYDTFAKLNIMAQATPTVAESTPQLMFSLVNSNGNKSWNGQRLSFNYASGDQAALFRIDELAGAGKHRLNFELLGVNNIYKNIKGIYGNSFIYSQENELPASALDNTYINSDGNVMFSHRVNNISFINSNYNIVQSGTESIDHRFPGANNITFMETDNSIVTPWYSTYYTSGYEGDKGIKGHKGRITWTPYTVGGHLSQHFLMDSDYTYLNGHNNSNFHGTYISSPSAKHVFSEYSQHDLEIGNMYGYTNNNSGNLIAIGRGLTYVKGQGDKILLGHFNMNDTDPDNVLVVGDGFVSEDYLNKIGHLLSGSNDNNRFFNAIGCKGYKGERGDMVNYYRHNLFTVNRQGYVGISDYTHPENSARYGFSGITAYCKGAKYEIPFSSVYAKLNVYDSMKEFQDIIDNYTDKVRAINNTMPTNKSITITAATNLDVYFGKNISGINSNSIINVTYVTTADRTKPGFSTTVTSTHQFITEDDQGHSAYKKVADVSPISAYNSLQYLYLRDTENNLTGFFRINN